MYAVLKKPMAELSVAAPIVEKQETGRISGWARWLIIGMGAAGILLAMNQSFFWQFFGVLEAFGIQAVLGDVAGSVPVSSNKSMIGHTLTAAGAVEAAISILTLQHQVLPPTINHEGPADIPLDFVPNEARTAEVDLILSNSFGFGGQNVCLVIGRNPD